MPGHTPKEKKKKSKSYKYKYIVEVWNRWNWQRIDLFEKFTDAYNCYLSSLGTSRFFDRDAIRIWNINDRKVEIMDGFN